MLYGLGVLAALPMAREGCCVMPEQVVVVQHAGHAYKTSQAHGRSQANVSNSISHAPKLATVSDPVSERASERVSAAEREGERERASEFAMRRVASGGRVAAPAWAHKGCSQSREGLCLNAFRAERKQPQ